METFGIVLAAGKGTRMKSKLPKALHKICGKPITRYVIEACTACGLARVVVVIGHGAEVVREGLGADVEYALQEEQLGTGHACMKALELLPPGNKDENVLVLPGDTPLITPEILSHLIDVHKASGADATVLTAVLDNPESYGRIIRSDTGAVSHIVEAKDASSEEILVREINTGIYCFKLGALRSQLKRVVPNNVQGEYYLTDVLGLMVEDGLYVNAVICEDPTLVIGINHRGDLARASELFRKRKLDLLMLEGVTITDPNSTYIDADVRIGPDTILHPQTIVEGASLIGEGCVIGPSTRLVDVSVGDSVTILYSNVVGSTIGSGTRIGPYANIRPGCQIGEKVKIGDFVELKNAQIGNMTSISHLAYVGDAVVGEETNIGAGAITCNYDGYSKHKTVIGKRVFVGSDVILIAPVEIGDGALIAAGSVITENVPADALAIARANQQIREGWAKQRRERMEKRKESK